MGICLGREDKSSKSLSVSSESGIITTRTWFVSGTGSSPNRKGKELEEEPSSEGDSVSRLDGGVSLGEDIVNYGDKEKKETRKWGKGGTWKR
ncbi:hypothetical protein SESBI_15872 [Sesbania bispinosa]|nr:hypothetical protein SESBI_15872 [Sesbania bispinosa]